MVQIGLGTLKIFLHTASASLEELWREAESLGRVSVDSWNHPMYRVQIRFERPGGTVVYAAGSNTNIAFALIDAINEARTLGAGR